MAEAIARQDALQEIEASSAGLAPGFVAEMTTQTLLRNGYAVDGLAFQAHLGRGVGIRQTWSSI